MNERQGLRGPARQPRALAEAVRHETEATGRAPCGFGIAMSRVPAKRWTTRADLFDCLSKARKHLDERFAEPICLPDLAALVGVSPFHFQRLFKECFNASPNEYLRSRRLAEARSLIESGMSVTAACFEVGFQSPSSFSRFFKRAFGSSPSAFRP
jgi:AraC-like DNA-binding protein